MAQSKTAAKGGKKAGCSSCEKSGATPEQIKKFKIDSIDLRQEMMTKRFDLQRETLKDTPDSARVTAIKADIEAIKVKLDALKTAAKLPKSSACCLEDCPLMDGNCNTCNKKKSCDKPAKAAKHCKDCKKTADCGCPDCNKKGDCADCAKKPDCDCSKKAKGAKK